MDLWLGHARKSTQCSYCGEIITGGSGLIQGRSKKRKGRTWPMILRWHPSCWYSQCLESLSRKKDDRVEEPCRPLGRPKMVMDDDMRRQRYLLIRRFNTLLCRRNHLETELIGQDLLDVGKLQAFQHLTEKMLGCGDEAETCGGTPHNWVSILGPRVQAGKFLDHMKLTSFLDDTDNSQEEDKVYDG